MARKSSVRVLSFLFLAFFLFHVALLHAQELSPWKNLTELPNKEITYLWLGDSLTAGRSLSGHVFFSYDGGATWKLKDLNIYDLYVGNLGSVVVVTTDRQILYSSDYGSTFQRVAAEIPLQGGSLKLMGEGNRVYLMHYVAKEDTSYYVSSDGGFSWQEMEPLRTQVLFYTVGPDRALYGLTVSPRWLMRYQENENQWVIADTIPLDLDYVEFGRDGRLYAWSSPSTLYRSEIGKTALQPFAQNYRVRNVPFWVVNDNGELITYIEGANGDVLVRISVDGQDTVEVFQLPEKSIVDPHIGPSGKLWILRSGNSAYGGYRYTPSNVNGSWEPVILPESPRIERLKKSVDDSLLVLTYSHPYFSADQGDTFDDVPYSGVNAFINTDDVDFDVNGKIVEIPGRKLYRTDQGVLFGYSAGSIVKSTDNGKNWKNVRLYLALRHMNGFGRHIYATGNISVHYSGDWGTTWDTLTSKDPVQYLFTSAVTQSGTLVAGLGTIDTSVAGQPVYATYRGGDTGKVVHSLPCDSLNTTYRFSHDAQGRPWLAMACGLFRSDDEGVSWKKIADIPEGGRPTSLLITESETIFLGTDEGLFRAQRISSVAGEGVADGSPGVTVQAVPNPVAGKSDIRFTLAMESHVRVVLYDPLGREVEVVAARKFEAGGHSIAWSVPKGLAPGSYMLRIETEKESAVRNVILVGE